MNPNRDELGRFAESSGGVETSFSKQMKGELRDFNFPTRGSGAFARGAKKFGDVKMFAQKDGSMLVRVDTSRAKAAAKAVKTRTDLPPGVRGDPRIKAAADAIQRKRAQVDRQDLPPGVRG